MNDPEETTLLDRCRAGDLHAWNELFDRHYASAYRFVFQLGYNISHEDAEEICQEAFMAVVRTLRSFRGGSAFQTWLFRIASNKARDFLEKRSAAKRGKGRAPLSLEAPHPDTGLALDPPSPAPAPDAELAASERSGLVHAAVGRLEGPCREIVELRYFAELSYDQLAEALGLNPKTVSSRLSRCLDRLEGIVNELFARENAGVFPV